MSPSCNPMTWYMVTRNIFTGDVGKTHYTHAAEVVDLIEHKVVVYMSKDRDRRDTVFTAIMAELAKRKGASV